MFALYMIYANLALNIVASARKQPSATTDVPV